MSLNKSISEILSSELESKTSNAICNNKCLYVNNVWIWTQNEVKSIDPFISRIYYNLSAKFYPYLNDKYYLNFGFVSLNWSLAII